MAWTTGMAEMSRVLRVAGSKVRPGADLQHADVLRHDRNVGCVDDLGDDRQVRGLKAPPRRIVAPAPGMVLTADQLFCFDDPARPGPWGRYTARCWTSPSILRRGPTSTSNIAPSTITPPANIRSVSDSLLKSTAKNAANTGSMLMMIALRVGER